MTNELEKEIIYAEIVEGDYNDVYSRKNVMGTWKQIEDFVKSYFTEEGLERSEEIGSDGYGLEIMYEPRDENGNIVSPDDPNYEEIAEKYEAEVEYYVDARPYQNESWIKDLEFTDLTEGEKQNYVLIVWVTKRYTMTIGLVPLRALSVMGPE